MTFRSSSKGRAKCALACRTLFAPIAALLMTAAMPAGAVMLGHDDTVGAPAMQSAGDDSRFDGVGRIECRDPERSDILHVATGWVLGSAGTVVTAAHLFFHDASAAASAARILDPGQCRFVLFDQNQHVRETASIRYVVSPWSEARFRSDSSYDIAVLKLDHQVKVGAIPIAKPSAGVEKPSVDLVAFHTGINAAQHAWVTRGQFHAFPVSQLRNGPSEMRITVAPRLFSTSADSTPGSSGGMYYDERLGAAVGLHVGALCDETHPSYDQDRCFNYGLRFDKAIVALVDTVAQDRPEAKLVLNCSAGSVRFALAPARQPRG